MDFHDRHVVVTGGAGALGTAVVEALIAAGAVCHVPCFDEAEAQQVPMWVGSAVRQLWQYANAELGPDSDFTEIVKCIEEWAGVEVGGNR